MANLILQRFDKDGIELIIDTQTGESFASQAGYARMSGVEYSTIRKRTERLGVTFEPLKRSQIETVDGFRSVTLIPEDLICQWLVRDNPELALKVMQLGVRLFLHTIAGFNTKSQVVKVNSVEGQITELTKSNEKLEGLVEIQKEAIASFGNQISVFEEKYQVLEHLMKELAFQSLINEYQIERLGKPAEKVIVHKGQTGRERLISDMAVFINDYEQKHGILPKIRVLQHRFSGRKVEIGNGRVSWPTAAILKDLMPEVEKYRKSI